MRRATRHYRERQTRGRLFEGSPLGVPATSATTTGPTLSRAGARGHISRNQRDALASFSLVMDTISAHTSGAYLSLSASAFSGTRLLLFLPRPRRDHDRPRDRVYETPGVLRFQKFSSQSVREACHLRRRLRGERTRLSLRRGLREEALQRVLDPSAPLCRFSQSRVTNEVGRSRRRGSQSGTVFRL